MKKNKKGFTLAEVLITLTIIGVVAALTAPALVKNTGYAKVGPSLAKFSNTFEVATETMMSEEGINVYSADATNLAAKMVMLANYINMIPYSGVTYKFSDGTGSKEYEIKSNGDYLAEVQEITDIIQGKKEDSSNKYDLNGDGRVSITDVSLLIGQRLGAGVPTVWKLKNGEVMAVMSVDSGGPLSGKGAYKGIIGEVIIDIERISDYCENITELVTYMKNENLSFSRVAAEELADMMNEVEAGYAACIRALAEGAKDEAVITAESEKKVDEMEDYLRTKHILRLSNMECQPKCGVAFLDMLMHLERISDHSLNIAQVVLNGYKIKLND